MIIVRTQDLRDEPNPLFVYVGRAWGGRKASPLGNPFRLSQGQSRTEVLRKYRQWLWSRIGMRDKAVMAALREITEESWLGCWCCNIEAGRPIEKMVCHAEVVAAAARWLQSKR